MTKHVLIVGSTKKALLLAEHLISMLEYKISVAWTNEDLIKTVNKDIDVIVDLDSQKKIIENIKFYKKMGKPFLLEIEEGESYSIVRKEVSDSNINALIDESFDLGPVYFKIATSQLQKVLLKDIEVETDIKKSDGFSNNGEISRQSYIFENNFILEVNFKTQSIELWVKGAIDAINFIIERKCHTGTIFQMKDILEFQMK